MTEKEATEQILNDLTAARIAVKKKAGKKEKQRLSAAISFTEEETSRMNPCFVSSFKRRLCVAHITKERCKRGAFLYTIKYMLDGYSITAKHNDLQKAKEAFISETWRAAS